MPRTMLARPRGQYEVRQLMPDSERDAGDPTYRIKSNEEIHERVAQESDLALSRVHKMTD